MAVSAAEVVFFPETVFVHKSPCLVVPISGSGATTETVMAHDAAKGRGMPTLAITCDPQSSLALKSSEALVLEPASEASVTTTQSLTSMVLSGQCLAALVGEAPRTRGSSRCFRSWAAASWSARTSWAVASGDPSIKRFAFVGSGSLIGLARAEPAEDQGDGPAALRLLPAARLSPRPEIQRG